MQGMLHRVADQCSEGGGVCEQCLCHSKGLQIPGVTHPLEGQRSSACLASLTHLRWPQKSWSSGMGAAPGSASCALSPALNLTGPFRSHHPRERSGEGLGKVWRKWGEGLEKIWRRSGESQQKVWRKSGEVWRRSGEGLEKVWRRSRVGLERVHPPPPPPVPTAQQ